MQGLADGWNFKTEEVARDTKRVEEECHLNQGLHAATNTCTLFCGGLTFSKLTWVRKKVKVRVFTISASSCTTSNEM